MRFTMSKDGRRRADMRVAVRVGRTELVTTLCYAVAQRDRDRDGIRTRKAVWETVREIYTYDGTESPYFWGDSVNEDEEEEIREWAETTVDRLFPEVREG